MIRWIMALMLMASGALAEARVDPDRSVVRDGWWSLRVELGLSRIVPYRVFTLDAPPRLVLDFEDVSWAGISPTQLLEPGRATALRFGPLADGWSRLVVDLAEPLVVKEAGLFSSESGADLTVVLKKVSADEFAAQAGTPPHAMLDLPVLAPPPVEDGVFVVAIDPGHGGIDPGADHGGVQESGIMLDLANELADALGGVPEVRVVLTRQDDTFVPLNARLTLARNAGADLFVSLHADALEEDEARGATVYTLTHDGGDAASRRIMERHARGDLLSGVDLAETEDRVATVLMDLARADTGPEGRRFAVALVDAMREAGVPLNSRPLREGGLVVLGAADFPAVLVEAGFLSNAADRDRLSTAQGRAPLVVAMARAISEWARQE